MPKKTKKSSPWNKGKSQGQKKAFTPQQIRMIYSHLDSGKYENLRDIRDLTLLCTAVDTALRATDLLSLKVSDVQNPDGTIKDHLPIKQKKTGEPHLLGLTMKTKDILREWIDRTGKFYEDYLFTRVKRRNGRNEMPITQDHYRQIVKQWSKIARVKDPREYSTHSLRRTKAVELWRRTQNPELVRQVLGQMSIAATSHYLGLNKQEAIDIARTVDFFRE